MGTFRISDRTAATSVGAADKVLIEPDEASAGDYDSATPDQIAGYTRVDYTVTYAASVALDRDNGEHQTVTLTGNITISAINNLAEGQELIIELIQDGTGSRAIDFGTTVLWQDGTAPTFSSAGGSTDTVVIRRKRARNLAVAGLAWATA